MSSFPFSYSLYPRCICPSYAHRAIFSLLIFPLFYPRCICPSYAHSAIFALLIFPLFYPRCICPSYAHSAIFSLLIFPLVYPRCICPFYAHSVIFSLLSFPLALNFLSFLCIQCHIFHSILFSSDVSLPLMLMLTFFQPFSTYPFSFQFLLMYLCPPFPAFLPLLLDDNLPPPAHLSASSISIRICPSGR